MHAVLSPRCLCSGWSWQQVTVEGVTSEVARRWRHRTEDAGATEAARMAQRDAELALYPVSVDVDPPFDLLTHRLGRGERQGGADVGAALTTHGNWQPSVQPSRRPSLVDAVVGSMGGSEQKHNVLVGEPAVVVEPTAVQAARVRLGLSSVFRLKSCRRPRSLLGSVPTPALRPLHCYLALRLLLLALLVVQCRHSRCACTADVGAGYGLLSLAAAARGHRVHAFELGPASLEALEASLAHNGFEHLVQVCGAERGQYSMLHRCACMGRAAPGACVALCSATLLLPPCLPAIAPVWAQRLRLTPSRLHSIAPASAQVHKEALGAPEQEGYTCILPRQPAAAQSSSTSGSGGSAAAAAAADVEVQRGYGPAAVHATPAEACQLMTRRSAGAWVIPESDRVAALRVSGALRALRGQRGGKLRFHSARALRPQERNAPLLVGVCGAALSPAAAWRSRCSHAVCVLIRQRAALRNLPAANGWEGFVLRGFAPLLASPRRPPVLAVEWNPAAMLAAGWKRPLRLVEW